MKKRFLALNILFFTVVGCLSPEKKSENQLPDELKANWTAAPNIDVDKINSDLVDGKKTIDVGIYFPSNFDQNFEKVTLDKMMASFKAAKEIYAPTDVQLNLLWVKTGPINPDYFSIESNKVPTVPRTEYANMYVHSKRHPSVPTQRTLDAFNHIIEPHKDNSRTIYLVVLQEVFYPFLAVAEGRNWMTKAVRTGGMSFPTYSFVNTLPKRFRGVMTITNLSRPDRLRSTIAHEIGHKAMNVSHEYMDTDPENEIFAEGGLMLYGAGEEIPSGEAGRWHLERLHLSPFIYRLNSDGQKIWNEDYREGGHYYDPIYGDKVRYFDSKPPIKEDW
ncbi:hypothetical protein [Roseivirga misakiensis]|uniref:Uncharacterized protein n=1 Tax=Roseivirga misakiensis TaxID=1563681 RepID=A0A1E5T2W1_9BACT|nr:hypothetical protein [Roseivirga misakiensis]OEK05720.1 hypothetical protein BFP71_06245 [Roseivirga misakiensis]